MFLPVQPAWGFDIVIKRLLRYKVILPSNESHKENPMAFKESETKQIDWIMQKFWYKNRPPEHARHQVDLSYEINNQAVEIFLLRAFWRDPSQTVREPIVKSTYVKKSGKWKIYWQRADMRWHLYEPYPEAVDLETVLQVVEEDPYGCFWG